MLKNFIIEASTKILIEEEEEFVQIDSVSSAKLSSSNLPPKRISSSICEGVEEVQDVIQLDSASSIQQQSSSRIQQSLSTAKGLQKKL